MMPYIPRPHQSSETDTEGAINAYIASRSPQSQSQPPQSARSMHYYSGESIYCNPTNNSTKRRINSKKKNKKIIRRPATATATATVKPLLSAQLRDITNQNGYHIGGDYSAATASTKAKQIKSPIKPKSKQSIQSSKASSNNSALSLIPSLYRSELSKLRYTAVRHQYLPYNIIDATSNKSAAQQYLPINNRNQSWSTGSGVKHELLIEINESTALLGWIRIDNRSVSDITIYTALNTDKQHSIQSYVQSYTDNNLPHNKVIMLPCGYLPTKFIKLRLNRGSPIALYSIQLIGVPIDNDNNNTNNTNTNTNTNTASSYEIGSDLYKLLISNPSKLVSNDSIKPKLTNSHSFRYPIDQSAIYNPIKSIPYKYADSDQYCNSINSSFCNLSIQNCMNHSNNNSGTNNSTILREYSNCFSAKTEQNFLKDNNLL